MRKALDEAEAAFEKGEQVMSNAVLKQWELNYILRQKL